MTFLLIKDNIHQNWNMSQYVRTRIAKNVKYYREKNFLTHEKLSLILGFDNSYISKLERADINITIDKLSAIAEYFNIDVIDLFK